uniref:Uncharacterized protein n=1 Tax=Guillardia theta TaxID=55529 RepID=A0A7S4K1A4_GUITH|mmetsp:Transcript_20056/g.66733  ORF Transcript_20056/g.66733 Transcript_20056/m.66733 type:complete len:686 (+) Transcript_20056:76-2133(+)
MSATEEAIGLKPVPPEFLRPIEISSPSLAVQEPSTIEHAKILLGNLQRQVEALSKDKEREMNRFSFLYEELKAKSEAEVAMRDRQLEDLRRTMGAGGLTAHHSSDDLANERRKNKELQERLEAAMLVVSNEGSHVKQLKEAEAQGKLLNEEIVTLKKELSDMQQRLVQSQQTFFELQDSQSDLQRNLKDKLEASLNEVATLKEEIANLQKLKEENSMLKHQVVLLNENIADRKSEEMTIESSKMKEENAAMQAAKGKLEEENRMLRDSIASLQLIITANKNEHESTRVQLQQHVETLHKEVEDLKMEKHSKTSLLEELMGVKTSNAALRKQIEGFEKQVHDLEQLCEKQREDINMSNIYKESHFKDQKLIEQNKKEIEGMKNILHSLSEKNNKLETDKQTLNRFLDKNRELQSDMDRLNKSYESLAEKQKLVEKHRRELEEEKKSLVSSLATACKLYEAKEVKIRREMRELKEHQERKVRELQDKISSADNKTLMQQAEICKLQEELERLRGSSNRGEGRREELAPTFSSAIANHTVYLDNMLGNRKPDEEMSMTDRNNLTQMSADRTRLQVSVSQREHDHLLSTKEDVELDEQLSDIRDSIERIRSSFNARSRFFDHNYKDALQPGGSLNGTFCKDDALGSSFDISTEISPNLRTRDEPQATRGLLIDASGFVNNQAHLKTVRL